LGRSCSARFGRVAVWPSAELGRVAGSGFSARRRAWPSRFCRCAATYPFAPRGFGLGPGPQCAGLFQSRRGSSRARRKPSGHRRPVRLLLGFQAGSPAFVFGPVGVRHRRPFLGPTRRSRGRGLCIWLRRRHFPPRPLARALGAFKKEQGRAGRAGPPGNFGPQLSRPVWQGCRLAFR
jgi:hypothetical protein